MNDYHWIKQGDVNMKVVNSAFVNVGHEIITLRAQTKKYNNMSFKCKSLFWVQATVKITCDYMCFTCSQLFKAIIAHVYEHIDLNTHTFPVSLPFNSLNSN